MARKRRAARTGPRFDPEVFLSCDGWSYVLLSGTPLLGSLREAEAAWEAYRVATWNLWLEWHGISGSCSPTLPPRGAIHHDGLTDHTWELRPHNTLTEVHDAVDADLNAVEDFRRRRPEVARSVEEGLAVLVEDLHVYRSLAESCAEDYNARTDTLYKLRGLGRKS